MNYYRISLNKILFVFTASLISIFTIPSIVNGAPVGCALDDAQLEAVFEEGFEWATVSPRNVYIQVDTPIYDSITNYLCAGIDPSQIVVHEAADLDESENICLEQAQFFPSSGGSCTNTCFFDPTGLFNGKWVSGSACSDDSVTEKLHTFISVSRPPQNCFDVNQLGLNEALTRCNLAQGPYTQWMEQSDSCERRQQSGEGYSFDQVCFTYEQRQEPDIEDQFGVGTGRDCTYQNEQQCEARFILKYPEESQQISSALCRMIEIPIVDSTGHQSGTDVKWCMNDEGLVGRTEAQIELEAEELANAAEAERLERIRAEQERIFNETKFGGSEGGLVPECGTDGTGKTCGWLEFVQLINNVVTFIIWAAAIAVVLAIFIAGFKLVTARGNSAELAQAKSAIFKAIGGFCVVLLAWLLVSTFMGTFLRQDFIDDDVSNLLENQ